MSKPATFAELVHQLERLDSYERTGRSGDITDLTGIRTLLDRMGNPQKSLSVIHVAGTNGKSLTAAMLSCMFESDGLTTGLYLSPAVLDIRESVQIGGAWLCKEEFLRFGQEVLQARRSLEGMNISRFDAVTAIAIAAFAYHQVGWALFEVGLGGTNDSTNVLDKSLAVITRIGYDHVAVLGPTLNDIAAAKLGIARANVPLVLGRQDPDLATWMEVQAKRMGAFPVIRSEDALQIDRIGQGCCFKWADGQSVEIKMDATPALPRLECLWNALVAREHLADKLELWSDRLRWVSVGLRTALPGRLDYRSDIPWREWVVPLSVFDGGHNSDALLALAEELRGRDFQNYVLVLAVSRDKLVSELTEPLRKLCGAASLIVACAYDVSRSATVEQLYDFLGHAGVDTERIFKARAISEAVASVGLARPQEVVVAGSFYFLAKIMGELGLAAHGGISAAEPQGPVDEDLS